VAGVLGFARIELSVEGVRKLERLADWLRVEAIPAGGLGPSEASVVESRHIADSLLFAAAWEQPPEECWDLGSGVGLPGLVLAIAWPTTRVVLIDRSAKRCDLARRAARVLELNIEVRLADLTSQAGRVEAIVSRAAMPATRLRPLLERMLAPGGTAVVSGGQLEEPGYERMKIPAGALDQPVRHLIMRRP
jgi:16S rRNA (guanine527-N7)-methyltransferase